MSDPIEDGGAAFPVAGFGEVIHGMSLRDWFAGQALAGMMTHPTSSQYRPLHVATYCYVVADNMLASRKMDQ